MRKSRVFRKVTSMILAAAMTAVLLAGCGGNKGEDSGSKADGTQELKTVRFGLLPYQDWMPWMLADELGYFEEAGIDLEVITFTDDITCAEALQSGDIDIACGNWFRSACVQQVPGSEDRRMYLRIPRICDHGPPG